MHLPESPSTLSPLVEVWEKISFSILASTVFYFINQHIPKVEKKVSCFHFEVNNVTNITDQIKELLDRTHDYADISRKDGDYPESVYANLCSVNGTSPPRKINEYSRDFANWNEFLKYKTETISNIVGKLIPLHDVVERKTLENLFKVEQLCYQINERREETDMEHEFVRFTRMFTDLMYCMMDLYNGLETKYKHTKRINVYRDKVQEIKNPFPYAYDYKMKYDGAEPPKLEFNALFLLRLRNFTISIVVGFITLKALLPEISRTISIIELRLQPVL